MKIEILPNPDAVAKKAAQFIAGAENKNAHLTVTFANGNQLRQSVSMVG